MSGEMIRLVDAISALDVSGWSLNGDPKSEAEFNKAFCKIVEIRPDGTAIESRNPNDWGITWSEIQAKMRELEYQQALDDLQEEVCNRLSQTDHWALSDNVMTPERTAYRQALRDILKTHTSLADVVWPDKPVRGQD